MVANVATDPKVDEVRAQLPAVTQTGYFNVGSNGPLSLVGQQALLDAATTELEAGRIVPGVYERNRDRNRHVAAVVAGIFDADPDEIAMTHATSEGLSAVLMGLDWQRGDEVLTNRLEHPGLYSPLCLLAHRFGVTIRHADLGHGEGDVVAAIAETITPQTRVIALSHVMWSTGAVMPLSEIAELARQRNVMLVVDGAQAAGQIPVKMHELGIDAYALPGQKWLCGPEATGALYVRRDRFADIAPTYLRYAQFDPSGYLIPAAGAMRYEIGEFYGPAVLAFEATLRWLRDEVGLDWAFARTAELGQRCHEGLRQVPGVAVITPPERMAGLVCFTAEGLTVQEMAAKLYERNFTIRYVAVAPCPTVARVATAWWNTEAEVDGLVAGVADIVANAGTADD